MGQVKYDLLYDYIRKGNFPDSIKKSKMLFWRAVTLIRIHLEVNTLEEINL